MHGCTNMYCTKPIKTNVKPGRHYYICICSVEYRLYRPHKHPWHELTYSFHKNLVRLTLVFNSCDIWVKHGVILSSSTTTSDIWKRKYNEITRGKENKAGMNRNIRPVRTIVVHYQHSLVHRTVWTHNTAWKLDWHALWMFISCMHKCEGEWDEIHCPCLFFGKKDIKFSIV